MQTLSIWIFPSLPPGSPQGFNTLGIILPQQLGFNCEETHYGYHLSKERALSGTQAKEWNQGKDEGHSREKNP